MNERPGWDVDPGNQTLAALLSARASESPAHSFVSFPGEELSYGELHDRATALARGLMVTGLPPGGHVGILMTNCVGPEQARPRHPGAAERALRDYIQREQRPKAQPSARPAPGPGRPTHCPNCGAPGYQAKVSRDPDPLCGFCHQPVPVEPVR